VTDQDPDALCADYLRRLEMALSTAPAQDRRQIVEEIAEHLSVARAELPVQSAEAVNVILARLGSPEDIAAAAAADRPPAASKKRRPLVAVGATVLLVAVIAASLTALLGGFGGSAPKHSAHAAARIVVPDVIHLSQPAAQAELAQGGFSIDTAFEAEGSTPPGVVFAQTPAPGSAVARGASIRLTISVGSAAATPTPSVGPSIGAPLVTVPNVIGLSPAAATAALAQSGLDSGLPESGAGRAVISQAPSAGSKVEAESVIALKTR
jgi:hypothetical protein